MTYSDYSLSAEEYAEYLKTNKCDKLTEIWNDVLRRIEESDLRKEAEKKGFTIEENPDLEEDIVASYKVIIVPGATQELSDYIIDKLYPFVVCLKD